MSECAACGGFGIRESLDSRNLRSIASYCFCAAGHQAAQMGKAEQINAARKALRERFESGKRVLPREPRGAERWPVAAADIPSVAQVAEEEYHGEF